MVDYQTPTYHVAMRDGLPTAIRPALLDEFKVDWEKHPHYGGKAQFFINIHRELLDGTQQIANSLESMLDLPKRDLSEAFRLSNIYTKGHDLIKFAHHHHQIEDHGYFPQFALMYPALKNGLNLLDNDHKVLNKTLDGAETALQGVLRIDPTTDQIAELYKHTRALEKIFNRHFRDEEDIIIPIFLRHE